MPSTEIPCIAVMVDTATGWGRKLISGINRYAKKHGPWDIFLFSRDQRAKNRLPSKWDGKGIIAAIHNQSTTRYIKAANLPLVNVSTVRLKSIEIPQVATDLHALSRTAAEHLLNCGFRNFAYCGLGKWSHAKYHQSIFAKIIREAGFECAIYKPSFKTTASTTWWR